MDAPPVLNNDLANFSAQLRKAQAAMNNNGTSLSSVSPATPGDPRRYYLPSPMTGLQSRRKCNNELSLYSKLDICDRVHNGAKRSALASEYDISNATVTNILKRESAIRAMCAESREPGRRRALRKPDHSELNQMLHAWYTAQDPQLVDANALCEKAREFASELADWDFAPSLGWLERFKRQFGVTLPPASSPSGWEEPLEKKPRDEDDYNGTSEGSPPTSNFGTSSDWLTSLGFGTNETAKELQEVQLANAKLQNKKLELEVRSLELSVEAAERTAEEGGRRAEADLENLNLASEKLRLEIQALQASLP